jgi:hypothetical protein
MGPSRDIRERLLMDDDVAETVRVGISVQPLSRFRIRLEGMYDRATDEREIDGVASKVRAHVYDD